MLAWQIPWTEEPGGPHIIHGVAESWGGGHTWRVCSRQPIRLRGSGMAEVEMDKELDLGSDLLKTHTHTRHTHQTPPSPRLRGSGMVEEEMDKRIRSCLVVTCSNKVGLVILDG